MRKIFLFLPFLLLLLSVQNPPRTLNFKIKVEDENGKAIPNCSINCMPHRKMQVMGVTDQNGVCILSIPFYPNSFTAIQIDAMHGSYGAYYITFSDLDKAKDGATLEGKFTMKLTKRK